MTVILSGAIATAITMLLAARRKAVTAAESPRDASPLRRRHTLDS
jgi:hypothetical protein